LSVQVSDSNWDNLGVKTGSGTLVITVLNKNDAPLGSDVSGSVNENAVNALASTVQGNDVDSLSSSQFLSYSISRSDHVCWYFSGTTSGQFIPFALGGAAPSSPAGLVQTV
jgi:hypothetical protein